jgi:Protein of unknown function DUF262
MVRKAIKRKQPVANENIVDDGDDSSVVQDLFLGEDPDEPQPGLRALEEKYRDQMRQIVPQKIELPLSTLPSMLDKQINLNPEFQRRGRWDLGRKSRFMESLIMNVPIPPVFLGEDDYGSYVVLDGRQRLTAIHDFLKNTYKLKGLKVWTELNGKNFDDMQKKKLDRFLTRRFIPAVLILKESSPQVKYDVFDRLNTGGVTANPMEIRNAVFQGDFTTLIRKLSENRTFRRLWGIPLEEDEREKNATYSKMADLELVLRFFALSEYKTMTLTYKDYLSDFVESRNLAYKQDATLAAADRERFERAVSNCYRILKEDAFRRPPTDEEARRSARSAPLGDALMIALADVDLRSLSAAKMAAIQKALGKLFMDDPAFVDAISTGTNGRGAIETRISAARRAVRLALKQ